MKKKCFIVVHRNYAEGIDACAFGNEDAAKKAVREDFEVVMQDMIDRGYEPVDLWDGFGNPEIFVRDTDIFYEWQTIETTIEFEPDCEDAEEVLN